MVRWEPPLCKKTEFGIYGFFEEYRCFSNFHVLKTPIVFSDGITYPTSEHLYMALKTLNLDVRKAISLASTGAKAKALGREVLLRPDWDRFHTKAMYLAVKEKFDANEDIREILLSTGLLYLEETNWWNDTFWGVCDGVGENMLGKTLMQVRDAYRSRTNELSRLPKP